MYSIRTETFLDAPPGAVWGVLADFAAYAAWNPLMVEARGELRVGARLAFKVRLPGMGGRAQALRATLVEMEPGRGLAWAGGVPGVLLGRHSLWLSPDGAGTRLVHGEDFTGVAVWLVQWKLATFKASYEEMNRALAERVRGVVSSAA